MRGGADDGNVLGKAEVDALLERNGGKRIANDMQGNCMYVSLMGKMGSYLDVANERKELARSALTTEKKRGLRRHFDTEAEFSTWVAGVEGDAWGDLLTLHHIAMTWSLTILVVQPGACPMVVVNRERQSKKKTQKKKPREVRVISLIGEHYEQVQMDPAQASALANAAPIAELIPSRLAVSPIPGMTKDATSPLEGDSPLLYCPVPCCQGSRFHRDIPLSGPGLRAHIAGHLAEGDHIPHDTLRKFGLGQCGVCDGIRAAKNETCLQCSRLVQAVPRPSPTIRTPAQEVDDRDMPDWYEIAAAPIPTHDTVPKAIDRAAAVEFAKVLEDVAGCNDENSWKRLCMFAKLVLSRKRGGANISKKVVAQREAEVTEWSQGEIAAMWSAATRSLPGRGPGKERKEPTKEEREKACVTEVRNGRLAAGMSRLHKGGTAPVTIETTAKLRAKHPEEAPQVANTTAHVALEPLKPIDALKAIKSMSKGSSPGPFGLRGDHLKEWMVKHPDLNLLPLMTLVLDLLRRGQAPPEAAEFLAGATLVALKKGETDVRPISAGNTLRRVVSKIEVGSVRTQARDKLLPGRQVGVAVDGGLEAATMVVADYVKRNLGKNKVIVLVDYENAFNSIHRSTFLAATRKYLPTISPWIEWCYGRPTSLLHGDDLIQSQRGAQQGDPAGPLLFSLGIKELTEEVKAMPGIDASLWYLDDGTIMGPPEAVGRALKLVQERSLAMGLRVKLAKCEVIALGQQTPRDLAQAGLPVCAHGYPDDGACAACEGKAMKVQYGGFAFLGAPIGDDEFCESYMDKQVKEFAEQLRLLKDLKDVQVGLTLLRQCEGFARMVFYMRAIGHACTHQYLKEYDKEVDAALASLMGDTEGLLPEMARRQAALPCRAGGMGVRRIRDHWTAAAMGSRSGLHELCKVLDPEFQWDAEGWKETATEHNRHVAEADKVDPLVRPATPVRQRELSAGILEEQLRRLYLEGDAADRARMNSLSLPHAGAWLMAPPTWEHHIPPEQFQAVCRIRMHLPLFADGVQCRQCGQAMDARGDHIFACKMGGHRILRHNAVRDFVYSVANEAGLGPTLEPQHLVLGNKKPADLFLSTGVGESRGRAIDVTVWTPTCKSMVQGAAVAKGYTATKAEAAKRGKHQAACIAARITFTPFALETTGGFGPAASTIWTQMLRFAADRKLGSKQEMSRRWAWGMGTTLQRMIGKSGTEGVCAGTQQARSGRG